MPEPIKKYVFITDVHARSSCPVREGNVLEDIANKLMFVVEYANSINADILIGGDFIDKPTVPNIVLNTLNPILLRAKGTVYDVHSNHPTLFDNVEHNEKTSREVMISSRVLTHLEEPLDLGSHILTATIPLQNVGKPQILVYHGFLNQKDGIYCVMFSDIAVTDPTVVLLGHDHVEYQDLNVGNARIIRPGAFLRGIRNDESNRKPKLVEITIYDDNTISTHKVEIPARNPDEIFHTKVNVVKTAEIRKTYDDVITQLLNTSNKEVTFLEAVKEIARPDVFLYLENILNQTKIIKSNK